jgi:hypothetical protein
MEGNMTRRRQPIPQCTASSSEPFELLGTPVPSLNKSKSKQHRLAMRAISSKTVR